nr:cache domain-containing protein [uncultured Campylobacter sp.]
MRSITNKIALMLIVALIVSFAAISAVSYYTAENKVVQLVSQNQAQILKDVNTVANSFFEDYLAMVKKIDANIEKISDDGDDIMRHLVLEKELANSLVTYVYYGREDGYFFQSDGKRTTLADNYDPRTRGWYGAAKNENKAIYMQPRLTSTNDLVVTFVAPAVKNGKFVGIVGIDIDIKTLSKKILDMGKT